jgi:hypothetical protein
MKKGTGAMLAGLGKSMLIKAARKGAGVPETGTLTTALLTTGASLLLSRERRMIGVALIAVGGLLLWRESERVEPVIRQARRSPVPPAPTPANANDAAA